MQGRLIPMKRRAKQFMVMISAAVFAAEVFAAEGKEAEGAGTPAATPSVTNAAAPPKMLRDPFWPVGYWPKPKVEKKDVVVEEEEACVAWR